MNRSLAVGGLVALISSTLLSAQETTTVEAVVKTVDLSDRSNPPPVMPVSVSVPLSENAPANTAVPTDLHAAWCGLAKLGTRQIAVLVGKSDPDVEMPDLMYIDLDGDGELTDLEQMVIETATRDQRGMTIMQCEPVDAELPGGAVFKARFLKAGDRPATASLQFERYLEAKTPAGIVAIVDKDFDGKYGTSGDMWALAQAGGRPASDYGLSAIGERVFHDGKLIGITVAEASVKVSSNAAKGPDPKDAAAHRTRVEHIWSDRFDGEREDFIAQRGLDTSRPLATQPISWNYVTFDDAIALGKKAGKPVFIDVMAFWCVWCYRMDYYTYPDAEVAKMLSNDFIAVKVIQEQDLVGDYDKLMKDKLQARGIPAMGIFDGEGNAVHTIGGWKKPEDFLKELETGKMKFAGQ